MAEETRRKGAIRMADIPADVLQALNEGREETITLVEWLAIDMATLLGHVIPQVGLDGHGDELLETARELADEGITQRLKGIGRAIFEAAGSDAHYAATLDRLANHTSDMARVWAAYAQTADSSLGLAERLERTRRFAADDSISVRECAWDSYRPYLIEDFDRGIELLRPWVDDPDENIRRCAVESTRPRGVWTAHIEALKEDPKPGLSLLEPVRSDSSRYVQRAVDNWLNDASKSQPEWVVSLCDRWNSESPTKETAWTTTHALRTLRKKGVVYEARHQPIRMKKCDTRGYIRTLAESPISTSRP